MASSQPLSQQRSPPMFHSISENDQRVKLIKRAQIERHWGCPMEDAVPDAIKPRFTGDKHKAKIGEQWPLAEWWRWGVEFCYKLADLAALTPNRLAFAQALMQNEVAQRHQDILSKSRERVEMLARDLEKIVVQLRESRTTTIHGTDDEDDSSDEDDEEEDEGEKVRTGQTGVETANLASLDDPRAAGNGNFDIDTRSERPTPIKEEPETNQDTTISSTRPRTSVSRHDSSRVSKAQTRAKAQIATLRADAARFKQAASQRKAKAYKLEAEMLEREAGLRE